MDISKSDADNSLRALQGVNNGHNDLGVLWKGTRVYKITWYNWIVLKLPKFFSNYFDDRIVEVLNESLHTKGIHQNFQSIANINKIKLAALLPQPEAALPQQKPPPAATAAAAAPKPSAVQSKRLEDLESYLEAQGINLDEIRNNIHNPAERGKCIATLVPLLMVYTDKYSIHEIADKTNSLAVGEKGRPLTETLKKSLEIELKARVQSNPALYNKLFESNLDLIDPTRQKLLERGLEILQSPINSNEMIDAETALVVFQQAWAEIQKYKKPAEGCPKELLDQINLVIDKLPKHVKFVNMNELPRGTIPEIKVVWKEITAHLMGGEGVEFKVDVDAQTAKDNISAFLIVKITERLKVKDRDFDTVMEKVQNAVWICERTDPIEVIKAVCRANPLWRMDDKSVEAIVLSYIDQTDREG